MSRVTCAVPLQGSCRTTGRCVSDEPCDLCRASAGELPDLVLPGGAERAAARPRSLPASSASLSVELDVGQELREIADSLPLSRSVRNAL